MLLVIGNVNGTVDSGKIMNIVPHSSTSSGLRMAGVNNTFSGVLIYIHLSIQVLLHNVQAIMEV